MVRANCPGALVALFGFTDFACRAKHRRKWVTRDCFAEPVIGPANGRTRWLAMTAEMLSSNARHCHCEKRVARRSNPPPGWARRAFHTFRKLDSLHTAADWIVPA